MQSAKFLTLARGGGNISLDISFYRIPSALTTLEIREGSLVLYDVAARIPPDVQSQILESCRVFRL